MGFSSSTAASAGAAGAKGGGTAVTAGTAGAASADLAQFSAVMGVAGAISSAFSAYYGASMQKQNFKHRAAMAEINAKIAELGAESSLLQGKSEVAKLTMQAGQLKSRQRTALAANGVDLGVGNAAEIQASTDMMKEIDTNTIKANAMRTAWGYRTNALNYRNNALTDRASASGISPFMSSATSLMSSAGQVAGQWYGLQKEGAFGTTTDTNGNTVNSWW